MSANLFLVLVLSLGCLSYGLCQSARSGVVQRAKAQKNRQSEAVTFGSPPAAPYANSINFLGLALLQDFRRLHGPDMNLVFSPLSISAAFSLVHLGARGSSRAEMEDVFGFEEDGVSDLILEKIKLSAEDKSGSLVANKVFIQDGMFVEPGYIELVTEDNIASVDFLNNSPEARDVINTYVEDATNGLIDEALDEGSIDSNTQLVAINSIFFSQSWKTAFPVNLSSEEEFIGSDSAVQIDYMAAEDVEVLWRSVPELNAQAVELPYKGDKFSMIIVLPDAPEGYEDAERNLERVITENHLFHGYRSRHFDTIRIPKFDVSGGLPKLKEHLQRLGLTRTFTNSDLSGITSTEINLSDVIHKARIRVNEKGTTAAAVTAGVFAKTAVVSEFIVEHPFLFFIVEKPAGVIWFQGTITQL